MYKVWARDYYHLRLARARAKGAGMVTKWRVLYLSSLIAGSKSTNKITFILFMVHGSKAARVFFFFFHLCLHFTGVLVAYTVIISFLPRTQLALLFLAWDGGGEGDPHCPRGPSPKPAALPPASVDSSRETDRA